MVHLHYSPFQFATDKQASEDTVNVKKLLKTNARLTKRDRTKAKLIPTTIPCSEAHQIIGSPNAFISPNTVDGMRMIHNVLGGI